jgi:hypothetical protein
MRNQGTNPGFFTRLDLKASRLSGVAMWRNKTVDGVQDAEYHQHAKGTSLPQTD